MKHFDEVHLAGSWVFGRKGDGYIALYSHRIAELKADNRGEVCDLFAKGRQNIWICEMGSRTQWGSFSKFIDSVSVASVQVDGLNVKYTSPSEGEIAFGWEHPLLVKGQQLPLRWKYRYYNPYCKALFDTTVIEIEKGGKKITLDFNKNNR